MGILLMYSLTVVVNGLEENLAKATLLADELEQTNAIFADERSALSDAGGNLPGSGSPVRLAWEYCHVQPGRIDTFWI